MNKTIIINISGTVFHIEEDAYEILKSYINDVKKHFGYTEDSFEIVTDIENRIAELFSELLKKENKQVIVLIDVENTINQMGKISDFENEPNEDSLNEEQTQKHKRLYRNPDEKILGGVCSGIAAYFDTDPLWVRLAMVIAMVFFGTSILLYVLLWIIMPEAKTRGEKLAMRGEKVTLETIKKSVEKEFYNTQKNFNGTSQIRGFIQSLIELIGQFVSFLFKVGGKLVGLFLLCIGLFFVFASTMLLFAGIGLISAEIPNHFPFNILERGYHNITFISWYLVVIIPVLAIILLGLKIVFNIKSINKPIGLSMLGIWVIGLLTAGYFTIKAAEEFKEVSKLKETTTIIPVKDSTYYLITNQNWEAYTEDTLNTRKYGINGRVLVKSDYTKKFYDNIDLNIEKSPDHELKLVTIFSGRGKDFSSAIRSAEAIEYTFKQKDSVLFFSNHYQLIKDARWRNQHVEMTLLVPENIRLVIDEDVNDFIQNINYWKCETNNSDQTLWIMKKDGLSCKEKKDDDSTSKNF